MRVSLMVLVVLLSSRWSLAVGLRVWLGRGVAAVLVMLVMVALLFFFVSSLLVCCAGGKWVGRMFGRMRQPLEFVIKEQGAKRYCGTRRLLLANDAADFGVAGALALGG